MPAKNQKIRKFCVLVWDFNSDELKHYDVLPYLRDCYANRKKRPRISKVPSTFQEMRDFVENESMYMFWSRCQWEMIIHAWPARKNEYKIDVHEQVIMNIDIITEILCEEYKIQ